MVTQPGSSAGRLKRLTNAAINADSAMMRMDGLAADATLLVEDLSDLVQGLEPAVERLDEVLVDIRVEFAAIRRSRENVDVMLARVSTIIDLVEWALAPAFAAKDTAERLASVVAKLRRTLKCQVRKQPAVKVAPVPAVQLTPMPLAG
ncbi:hypothetical protein FOS14_09480 [Skermania sp. ID1734]|uniref:hypothetical protein n=1 Tax=Skermania sp. ID1734 TaxID=2597516 RepID=UPI001180E41D|nr:hypothetical protein [Skermania sp. ID1734]TSE00038.1 hypothetical protein FOS14_09480 [Skermania sp. ID1734]